MLLRNHKQECDDVPGWDQVWGGVKVDGYSCNKENC